MKNGWKKLLAVMLALGITTNGVCASAAVGANQEENQAPKAPEKDSSLVVDLDMESMQENKVVNTADGTEFLVEGESPTLTEGLPGHGKALVFDGSNYMNLGQVFQPENAYTIMGWVKKDVGGKATQAFVGRGVSGNVQDQLATLLRGNKIYHCVSTSDGSSNQNYQGFIGGSFPIEEWAHIALTRSGSRLLYYINGELAYTARNMKDADFNESSLSWVLGRDEGSDGMWDEHSYTGLMDDVRLYSRELSQAEIKTAAKILGNYSISSAENGSLTLTFEEAPESEPKLEDFALSFAVGGAPIAVSVTGYTYDAAAKTASFTFPSISNDTPALKTVEVSVSYGGKKEKAEFSVSGINNDPPAVSDAVLTNLSAKLGTEPHVKGMLEVGYAFSDPDGDNEGESKYQWYMADAANGEYTAIQGVNTQTIILLEEYEGKYLKCEVKAVDQYGNTAQPVMSAAMGPVRATVGNPLTDWFLQAEFGASHHILAEFAANTGVTTDPADRWDAKTQSWNDFIGEFDADAYAAQISQTGVKYVIITLGQNAAEYCAPNLAYDKMLREAGLLGEGEVNPKTVSFENDLPMKMADALEPYGIKVMLYLPSNVPHSAHWDSSKRDYLITTKALNGTPGSNGPNSQEAKKKLCEMVQWWSEHYGDKIAGWWFDGMYPGGTLESQNDMSLEYNVSTLANAAKAGNPYNILSFNQGTSLSWTFSKNTKYHDYTCGEYNNFNGFPVDGRWAKDTTDCQNFEFGPLSSSYWGWGCPGVGKSDDYVVEQAEKALEKSYVMGFDTYVNHKGKVDPDQLALLIRLKGTLDAAATESRVNLAKNKPASASTSYGGFYDAAKAVDGNDFTHWMTLADSDAYPHHAGEFLAVDLGTEQAVNSVVIDFNTESGKLSNVPDSITIQVKKSEADSWTTVLEKGKTPAPDSTGASRVEYGFVPVQARFVRVLLEDGTLVNGGNAAISEVEVYAPAVYKLNLTNLYNACGDMTEENYTEESWAELQRVLLGVKAVLANPAATEDEVDGALTDLVVAIGGLDAVTNYEVLRLAIDVAKPIVGSLDLYVPSTVEGLSELLTAAEKLYANDKADQKEVNAMAKKLLSATAKARLKADKAVLKSALDRANGLDTSLYTKQSLKPFLRAYEDAKKLFADETLSVDSQAQVDAAAAALTKAIAELVPIKDSGDSPKTGDTAPVAGFAVLGFAALGAAVLLKKRNKPGEQD